MFITLYTQGWTEVIMNLIMHLISSLDIDSLGIMMTLSNSGWEKLVYHTHAWRDREWFLAPYRTGWLAPGWHCKYDGFKCHGASVAPEIYNRQGKMMCTIFITWLAVHCFSSVHCTQCIVQIQCTRESRRLRSPPPFLVNTVKRYFVTYAAMKYATFYWNNFIWLPVI